jgi:aryl-alcohol dehydrogenase-like predicted oxidoreductase
VKLNGRPDHIFKAADASLKRLKIDEIDLYMLQAIDPKVPVDETIGAMGELVAKGKVRAIGLCGAQFQAIETAMRIFPLSAVGMTYSLLASQEAEELRALTSPLGLSFLAFEPLGKGVLAGNGGDPLASLTKKLECSKAQLGLAYLLAQGRDVIPIFGTRTAERVYENIGAANIQLSAEDLDDLHERFKKPSGSSPR